MSHSALLGHETTTAAIVSHFGPVDNMTKAATESSKAGKRKGTRSVSSLSPSQLARKRANDREAQRAIRARTKEHIENLERELEELRSQQGRDKTIQDLLRKNKTLEDECRRLRDTVGLSSNGGNNLYQPPYHDSGSQSSFGHTSPEYHLVSDGISYTGVHDASDSWSSTLPTSVPSTVSSPASSGATDDFGPNYFPTSAPSAVLDRSSMTPGVSSPTTPCIGGKMGFEDIKSEYTCHPIGVVPVTSAFSQQQPVNVYSMYYPGSPAIL